MHRRDDVSPMTYGWMTASCRREKHEEGSLGEGKYCQRLRGDSIIGIAIVNIVGTYSWVSFLSISIFGLYVVNVSSDFQYFLISLNHTMRSQNIFVRIFVILQIIEYPTSLSYYSIPMANFKLIIFVHFFFLYFFRKCLDMNF